MQNTGHIISDPKHPHRGPFIRGPSEQVFVSGAAWGGVRHIQGCARNHKLAKSAFWYEDILLSVHLVLVDNSVSLMSLVELPGACLATAAYHHSQPKDIHP